MPEIIKESKQLEALKEVQRALDLVAKINVAEEENTDYILTAQGSSGVTKVPLDQKDQARVMALLAAQRTRLVKSIHLNAERHRIALTEEDSAILNGGVKKKRGKPKKLGSADQEDYVHDPERENYAQGFDTSIREED